MTIYTVTKTSECPTCKGSGRLNLSHSNYYHHCICQSCNGTGKLTSQVSLKEVLIELGFVDPITTQDLKS